MLHYRLEVFRAVAEWKSTTKAAASLHLSQPAVSKHIHLLEETMRVALFRRTPKGMELTRAGAQYLDHVNEAARIHDQVVQRLQAPSGRLTGRLRIGSNKTVLAYHLPKVLAEFKRRHPMVICDVIDGNTDYIIGALIDQRVDVALVEGPCNRPDIQVRPFLHDDIVWICAPDDPLARKRNPSMKMVLSRPLIIREVGAGGRQFMSAELARMRVSLDSLNIFLEIPHPEAIKRLVADRMGIGFVFRIGVASELASGTLVEIKCPRLTITRPFSMLLPQGPAPQGLARAFETVLFEVAEA